MECHRQRNYKSQDALCFEGTPKTPLSSGRLQMYQNVADERDADHVTTRVLGPQLSRAFGAGVGGPRLARQLWILSELVPEPGGGV